MEIQRRIFLGSMGAGALAVSVDAQSSTNASVGGKWDVSWADRLNRRHRAVFDSTSFSGGGGLVRAVVWKRHHQEVYGTAPEDMNAVLVIRAEAIWLAMNDVFWNTYKVGKVAGFEGKKMGSSSLITQ